MEIHIQDKRPAYWVGRIPPDNRMVYSEGERKIAIRSDFV